MKKNTIIVNGTQEFWTDHEITYEQVVQIAFPGSTTDQLFSVTYANEHGQDGSLAPGGYVKVKDGIRINVVKTNRS